MSQPTEVKPELRYTKEHEWLQRKDGEVLIGITAFAVDQLGDITLVNWDVEPGDRVKAGQVFGTIESVKTLSDLFAPVSGTVLRLNNALESSPELVNKDCWGAGWMLALEPDDAAAMDALLDAGAYSKHIASLDH
jgi:glycine cleavage system H protein